MHLNSKGDICWQIEFLFFPWSSLLLWIVVTEKYLIATVCNRSEHVIVS